MADPLQSGPRPAAAPSLAGDEARIEQLLVTGLDHYFDGQFEQAINVWTRVLFLDRDHDRARAYIERARSAQAERQRASEALVHQGLEAFDRGDVARARELLSEALERGAPHEVALGVLGRIDRLEAGAGRLAGPVPGTESSRRRRFARGRSGRAEADGRPGARRFWMAAGVVAAALTGVVAWAIATWDGPAAWLLSSAGNESAGLPSLTTAPLPLPAPTETYLTRGRELSAAGRLRDALRVLDRVPVGDSLRPDADRLRGQIQRALLDTSNSAVPAAPTATPSRE